jgi:hypothetical protein
LDKVQSDFVIEKSEGRQVFIRQCSDCNPLAPWGCVYANTADRDARMATVLWRAEQCASVLTAVATVPAAGQYDDRFNLENIACEMRLVSTKASGQHLLFRDGARSLQLAVHGADVRAPVLLAVNAASGGLSIERRLKALESFDTLYRTGRFPARPTVGASCASRLRVVLQALDGRRAGASYREIAEVLFGLQRVADDWSDPGAHLRDCVRRAVYRGRALMDGGYRQFLS